MLFILKVVVARSFADCMRGCNNLFCLVVPDPNASAFTSVNPGAIRISAKAKLLSISLFSYLL